MAWEAAVWARGGSRTLDEFLAVRLLSVGVNATKGYLGALAATDLSDADLADPTLRAATEAALMAATLDNDRYSYPRERRLGTTKHNILDVVRCERPDYSVAEAVGVVVALRDRILGLYLRLRAQLLDGARPEIRHYLNCVDRVPAGNIAFGAKATRYLSPDTAHAYQCTASPLPDLPDGPPPYPYIAWWWDCLDD